jgi:DNA (cytosine-5)-methyltransferase 1
MFELLDDPIGQFSVPAFRYADLFAGIGGFAAVFRSLGGEHAYAVEIDAAAAAVYARNWGHNPLGDITEDANDSQVVVADHDILAAGFPCQPFSKSGAQRGMDEVRGTLFFHIEKILRARKPTVVVLENVRNLVGPRHRHEWEVIIAHLRDAGYQVSSTPAIFSPHTIAPEHGGSPQVRERVFITGTLVPPGMVMDPEPVPIALPASVRMGREWDLINDLPMDQTRDVPGTEITAVERAWIDHWDVMVQVLRTWRAHQSSVTGEQLRNLPGFPIWTDAWVSDRVHAEQLDGAPAWKADFLRKNVDLYRALKAFMGDAQMKDWLREVRTFPESRRKLEWQAQGTASLWDCVISLRPSGLRAKRPTHLPALVAITQTPIIGPLGRRLSTREAARLQGLADTFEFGDQRDSATFKQLGNGVNTGVVHQVLRAHVERDKRLLMETEAGRRIVAALLGADRSGVLHA